MNTKINPKYFLRTSLDEKISKGYGFLTGSKRFKKTASIDNPGPGDYTEYEGTIMKRVLEFKKRKSVFSIKNKYMRRKENFEEKSPAFGVKEKKRSGFRKCIEKRFRSSCPNIFMEKSYGNEVIKPYVDFEDKRKF